MIAQMCIRDTYIVPTAFSDDILEVAEQAEQDPERQKIINEMWECPKLPKLNDPIDIGEERIESACNMPFSNHSSSNDELPF